MCVFGLLEFCREAAGAGGEESGFYCSCSVSGRQGVGLLEWGWSVFRRGVGGWCCLEVEHVQGMWGREVAVLKRCDVCAVARGVGACALAICSRDLYF